MFRTIWGRRSKSFSKTSKLVVGSSGSGKSYSEVHAVVDAAMSGEFAILLADPHGTLAKLVFQQLVARGQEHRIVYDQLNSFSRVPGYRFLRPPKVKNPYHRESLIEMTARQFADILLRRRGMSSLASAPQTEEYTMKAAMLLLHQRRERPATHLRYALRPDDANFRALLDNCTHEETRYTFSQIGDGTIRQATYAPARRLIDGVCASPAFEIRCGTECDIHRLFDEYEILLVEGGTNAVSQDALQTILGTLILEVINYVRSRGRSKPSVLIVADEANNANLISGYEVRALNECRKMGLTWHILTQSLNFSSSYVTESVLQNTTVHHWFFCSNNAVAQQAAADLGEADYRSDVRQLRIGECYVKDRANVYRQQVPRLAEPWVFPGLTEAKALAALERIRKRSEYRSPSCRDNNLSSLEGDGPCEGQTHQTGDNVTNKSSRWRKRTSSGQDTHSDSSPARRLRTGGS